MTNKERIEKLKSEAEYSSRQPEEYQETGAILLSRPGYRHVTIKEKDWDWLIEQAERLEKVMFFVEEVSRGPYKDSCLKSLHESYQKHALAIIEGEKDEE